VTLAWLRLTTRIKQAGIGAGMIAAAGVISIPVIVLFLMALATWFIELGLRPSLSYAAAGSAGLAAVIVLALLGKSRVAP